MFQCGRLLLVLLCSVALTLTGCSKKEGSSAAGGVNASAPDSELLERLPVTTLGFIFSENGSKAYAEYKGSSWYQPAEKYFEKLSSLESELPGLAVALTVAKKAALWDGAAEKPGFESVLFVAKGATGQQPDIGAITKAPSPIDPAAFLAAMENAMKEGGATPAREKVGEVEVLTTTMEINGSSARKVYIVALPERYGMVSNPALIERLTRSLDTIPEGERGIRVLKNTPAFQRAQARATTVPGQFLFGFLAVTELEDVVRTALPPGTPGVNDGTVEALPFESISFCRSMSGGLHDYVWLGTKEGALPAEAVTALSGTSDHAGMRNAPVNAVGVLSLDGALLRAAKSTAVAGMTPEEQSQTASMSAPLEGMKGLTLVVRNAAGASPFPEITLMAETKDPAMLQATLKTVLGGLAAGGGLPVSQWQTKEIAGAKVDFIVSPIGVGLFMGTVNNSLILSSADGAFNDLIGGKTAPEVKRFFEGDRLKGEKSPLVLFYLSGAKLVGLIESLQASLAMFTGGKNMVEPEDLAALRSLGEIGTAVSFSDAAFRVHSTYVAESGK